MGAAAGIALADPAFPVIRVSGLVNRFGRQVVHDALDMTVYRNEIFGIVGASGTGKSVLLRSILGLQQPSAGRIELYGQDMGDASRGERIEIMKNYGVTFQQGALVSSLSVADNIQLPLREYLQLS